MSVWGLLPKGHSPDREAEQKQLSLLPLLGAGAASKGGTYLHRGGGASSWGWRGSGRAGGSPVVQLQRAQEVADLPNVHPLVAVFHAWRDTRDSVSAPCRKKAEMDTSPPWRQPSNRLTFLR